MEQRLWKLCLLISCILALCLADEVKSKRQRQASVTSRAKRSKVIGDYGSVVCNRTVWKTVFEPYLRAEARYQRNGTDEMKARYELAYARVNNWKNRTMTLKHNVSEACGLQVHLECGEQSRCICGTGGAPYSYVPGDGGTCLAKRGSHCRDGNDCSGGLLCRDHYCGGSAAFLEEYSKVLEVETQQSTQASSSSDANFSKLFLTYFFATTLALTSVTH